MTEPAQPPATPAAPAGAQAPDTPWATLAQARALSQGQPSWHWQRIDALARRTQAHSGAVRALLEQRLHTLLKQLPAAHTTVHTTALTAPSPAPPPPAQRPRPLRALLEHLHQRAAANLQPHAPAPPANTSETPDTPAPAAPVELKAVQQHRHTWARLRAAQRVAQSHTALPPQAGPMNTQRLLHQALLHMHATSPGYLQHFSTQAEALMWLQSALAPPAPANAPTRKTSKPRKR